MRPQSLLDLPAGAAGERIAYGGDPNQFGELHLPAGPGPGPHAVVVFIHRGFWRAKYDLTHARPLCNAIAEAGAGRLEVIDPRSKEWPTALRHICESIVAPD